MQITQTPIESRKIAKLSRESRHQFLDGEMAIKITLERGKIRRKADGKAWLQQCRFPHTWAAFTVATACLQARAGLEGLKVAIAIFIVLIFQT